jgi:hypothetical protein
MIYAGIQINTLDIPIKENGINPSFEVPEALRPVKCLFTSRRDMGLRYTALAKYY